MRQRAPLCKSAVIICPIAIAQHGLSVFRAMLNA